MIGIISENNILTNAIIEILQDFPTEAYQKDHKYQAIITLCEIPCTISSSVPIITLGHYQKSAIANLDLPIKPYLLIQKVTDLYQKESPEITFENKTFIFYKNKRYLEIKPEKKIIPLTEKENEILTCLAENFPNTVSKDNLLQTVWKYHQDTETHTVESHIYTLRQKMGDYAHLLIQSSPIGYSLVA